MTGADLSKVYFIHLSSQFADRRHWSHRYNFIKRGKMVIPMANLHPASESTAPQTMSPNQSMTAQHDFWVYSITHHALDILRQYNEQTEVETDPMLTWTGQVNELNVSFEETGEVWDTDMIGLEMCRIINSSQRGFNPFLCDHYMNTMHSGSGAYVLPLWSWLVALYDCFRPEAREISPISHLIPDNVPFLDFKWDRDEGIAKMNDLGEWYPLPTESLADTYVEAEDDGSETAEVPQDTVHNFWISDDTSVNNNF